MSNEWEDMLDSDVTTVSRSIQDGDPEVASGIEGIIDELATRAKDPESFRIMRGLSVVTNRGTKVPGTIASDVAQLAQTYCAMMTAANDEQRSRITPRMEELVHTVALAAATVLRSMVDGSPLEPGKVRVSIETSDRPEACRTAEGDAAIVMVVGDKAATGLARKGEAGVSLAMVLKDGDGNSPVLAGATLLSNLEQHGVDIVGLAKTIRDNGPRIIRDGGDDNNIH